MTIDQTGTSTDPPSGATRTSAAIDLATRHGSDVRAAADRATKSPIYLFEEPHDRKRLDATASFQGLLPLEDHLRSRILGQNEAIQAVVDSLARVASGLRDPRRPVVTMLMLGPTGVGKTETAKAVASALFGSDDAMTRINCEEYAHGHEISKLLGSPPGYVGMGVEPLLSQRHIDLPFTNSLELHLGLVGEGGPIRRALHTTSEERPLSVVLFDEIEKAHPLLWNALLGILDDGVLTLSDNQAVDFTGSIILLTSNVGSSEIDSALHASSLGFRTADAAPAAPRHTTELALAAARRHFPVEFLNRLDRIPVYSPLDRAGLEAIFDKYVAEFHARTVRAQVPLLIRIADAAKDWILERGTDPRLGARPLRRAVERHLVDPVSRLVCSGQLVPGDVIEVDLEAEAPVLFRLSRQGSRNGDSGRDRSSTSRRSRLDETRGGPILSSCSRRPDSLLRR